MDLWAQVLGISGIGIHDDFIALGGDSILATQLLARVRDLFDIEYSMVDFFDRPTVARMSAP
jgi:acyl carrier protein